MAGPPPLQPEHQPDISASGGRSGYRAAILFAAAVTVVIAAAVVILSLDAPLTRQNNPRTLDAYVGGDVTAISARVGGYLVGLAVSDNQVVRAGQLVAQIDDADYAARVGQAEAALNGARAQLAAIAAQQAVLLAQIGQSRSAVANSTAATLRTNPELARQRALIRTDVGVSTALDQAIADQRRMQADVAIARAQLQSRQIQTDVLAAQRRAAAAAVAARAADLALARLQLGWTRILAPIDGVLDTRRVRVGDLMAPGTAVVSVTPLDTVWVDANFIERQLPRIRLGQPAILRIDAYPGERLHGVVVGMSPASGGALSAVQPDNTTGNFTKVAARVPVRIRIDWGDSPLRGRLRPGMSAIVDIETGDDAGPADANGGRN